MKGWQFFNLKYFLGLKQNGAGQFFNLLTMKIVHNMLFILMHGQGHQL